VSAVVAAEHKRGLFSVEGFRWILVSVSVVLAICAASILVFIPSSYSIPVVDLSSLPVGLIQSGSTIYTYYPNATLEIREAERTEDQQGRVLRGYIEKTKEWSGFGFVTGASAEPDAVLRLRWRWHGTTPHVQVDIREHEAGNSSTGEVYSTVVPFVGHDWVTTDLPLRGFSRNEFYQPSGDAGNRILDSEEIALLAFTFPPDCELMIEIASVTFEWYTSRWQALAWVLFASFLVVLVLEAVQLLLRGMKVERTLKRSEANYLAISNAVKEGIWVLDVETGSVLDVNRMACDMVRLSRASMIGRGLREVLQQSGMEDCDYALERIFSNPYQEMECMLKPHDSDLLWVELRTTRIAIESRERLLMVVRDVGEKKSAEKERLRLEQRLMHSQKMEALGKLAGGVAHDFNNILTGITLAAGMATLDADPDSQVAVELGRIQELAERAASLTRQMLTFGRRQDLHPVPLRLNALVEHSLILIGRLIGEDVRLSFTARTEQDLIRADRTQIEQILMNLAVNSRDAMPAGGELRLRTSFEIRNGRSPDLNLPAGEYVLLEIEDTGSGMDSQTQRHIFEPFFTTKEPGRGTGLGLATVYGIVANHGGAIAVDTALGVGTIFRIYFPKVELLEGISSVSASFHHSVPHGSGLILVIEDDPSVRALVEDTLTSFGYRTISASCAEEAELVYREFRNDIDLLLTDIVMPGESGPRFFQRLAAADPALKVLFMSGYADSASSDVLGVGLPFLQKPFQPIELARIVTEILAQPARAS
jgi:PAS domain S-box-containing protein